MMILQTQKLRVAFWHTALYMGLVCVAMTSGCSFEVDTSVSINQSNPPTFKLSGSGNLYWFDVIEDIPENNVSDPMKERFLWKIDPITPGPKVWRVPPITYGKVPPGFTQTVPADGSPPPALVAGKTYIAAAPGYNANGGGVFFEIKDGKAIDLKHSP
jgi:hypothetical protein